MFGTTSAFEVVVEFTLLQLVVDHYNQIQVVMPVLGGNSSNNLDEGLHTMNEDTV